MGLAELRKELPIAWKRLKLFFIVCVCSLCVSVVLSSVVLGRIMGWIWGREAAWQGLGAGAPGGAMGAAHLPAQEQRWAGSCCQETELHYTEQFSLYPARFIKSSAS